MAGVPGQVQTLAREGYVMQRSTEVNIGLLVVERRV